MIDWNSARKKSANFLFLFILTCRQNLLDLNFGADRKLHRFTQLPNWCDHSNIQYRTSLFLMWKLLSICPTPCRCSENMLKTSRCTLICCVRSKIHVNLDTIMYVKSILGIPGSQFCRGSQIALLHAATWLDHPAETPLQRTIQTSDVGLHCYWWDGDKRVHHFAHFWCSHDEIPGNWIFFENRASTTRIDVDSDSPPFGPR